MRPLEIFTLVGNIPLVLYPFLRLDKTKRWVQLLPALGTPFLILHLLLEGYRWQMLPGYGVSIVGLGVGIVLAMGKQAETPSKIGRRLAYIGGGVGILALVVCGGLGILFPVPASAAPTGPYPIGRVSYHFVDTSRNELYGEDPSAYREMMVTVWYPAEAGTGGERGQWMEGVELGAPAIAEFLDLPSWFLDHLKYSYGHARLNAEVSTAETSYPVMVFSHGWGGTRFQNSYQMEELASFGYVAVAIDHTYGAVVSVFPDGRAARQNYGAMSGDTEEEYNQSAYTLVNQWADDISFALDQMESLNAGELDDDRFLGRLDLDRVGVLGHSTGGGAAVLFCTQDERCKAGLGMDAWVEPLLVPSHDYSLSQPFLFMYSEEWESGRGDNREQAITVYDNMQAAGYWLSIEGTRHYDFSDLPMLSPLAPQLGLKGPIDGSRALRIINDYTMAFFDYVLKGIESPLLDGLLADDYPEVDFESNGR